MKWFGVHCEVRSINCVAWIFFHCIFIPSHLKRQPSTQKQSCFNVFVAMSNISSKHHKQPANGRVAEDEFDGRQRNAEVLDILWHQAQEQRPSSKINKIRTFFRRSQVLIEPCYPAGGGEIDVNTGEADNEYYETDGTVGDDHLLLPTQRSSWRLRRALRLPSLSVTEVGEPCNNCNMSLSSSSSVGNHRHPHPNDHSGDDMNVVAAFSSSSTDNQSRTVDDISSISGVSACDAGYIPMNTGGAIPSPSFSRPASLDPDVEAVTKADSSRCTKMIFPWRAFGASEVV